MDSYSHFSRTPHDQKQHYNELDDDYGAPRHFAVETALSPTQRRAPSFPMTPGSTAKLNDDGTDDFHPIYPPISSQEIELPRQSLWARASFHSCNQSLLLSYILPSIQIIPESMASRLFVLTVLIETAVDLAIEGDLLIRLNDTTPGDFSDLPATQQKMPVYLALFALAQ